MANKKLDMAANILSGVGAANWGLAEFAGLNLVDVVAGATAPIVGTIAYAAVGLSGLYVLGRVFKVIK